MFNYSNSDRPQGFDWSVFIAGIISWVVAFFMLRYPRKSLNGMVLIFAILSIIQGVMWLGSFAKFHHFFDRSWTALFAGVIDLMVGLWFLFYQDIAVLAISAILAIWFLSDSIIGIVFSAHLLPWHRGYFWFNLLMNIFSLFLGLLMLMNPMIAGFSLVYVIAFYLLVFGFNEIVVAWMHR